MEARRTGHGLQRFGSIVRSGRPLDQPDGPARGLRLRTPSTAASPGPPSALAAAIGIFILAMV
ncbi:MAG: hypothetical protein ACK53L_06365, partial [Pirellulaceae bacterium]